MREKLHVCISLDVEEEGLFTGAYASHNVTVNNVALLPRLEPISLQQGFPLTLFCAYSVFSDPAACETAIWMHERCGAEIAAHLHNWSTPPWSAENTSGPPLRTHRLDPQLLRQRLASLLAEGRAKTGQPLTSFRMGRWDLKKEILPLLIEAGITVDSSICPLRSFRNGPDHFLAPASPYFAETGSGTILEVPLTQVPLSRSLARIWHGLLGKYPSWLDSFHFFAALSANPVWHSETVMKAATRLHYQRGGRLLNLFWHSSEMMAGASPNVPDEAAASRLLAKITSFCAWLRKEFPVEAITACQIPGLPIAATFPVLPVSRDSDW